jgi:hypothetical protein
MQHSHTLLTLVTAIAGYIHAHTHAKHRSRVVASEIASEIASVVASDIASVVASDIAIADAMSAVYHTYCTHSRPDDANAVLIAVYIVLYHTPASQIDDNTLKSCDCDAAKEMADSVGVDRSNISTAIDILKKAGPISNVVMDMARPVWPDSTCVA